MIRIVASAACAAALASATPAFAQIAPINTGGAAQVNRAIPGTPGSPGTVVNPGTGSVPRAITPPPVYRNGVSVPRTPSVDAANRSNGVVGLAGVSPVAGVRGVRAVGSAPAGQRAGASRPTLTWQP